MEPGSMDAAPAVAPAIPHTPRRYPHHLARGRAPADHVPLHRRGMSNKYERMEDLLREAGYKETRIFTPETERTRGAPEGDGEEEEPVPVNAVVRFFGGLFPSRSQSTTDLPASYPATPTADPDADPDPPSPTPRSRRAVKHAGTADSKELRRSAAVDRARGHPGLRPAVSSPAISTLRKGATLTPSASARGRMPPSSSASIRSRGRQPKTVVPAVPPLPQSQSWLSAFLSPTPSPINAVFQDNTNSASARRLPPGFLLPSPAAHTPAAAQIQRTHVVCHSAPSSRSASRVRLPTLARTRIQNANAPESSAHAGDGAHRAEHARPQLPSPSRFLLPSRRTASPISFHPSDPDDDSPLASESDGEELTFDALLLPAPRQGSIRALRRHLQHDSDAQRRAPRRGHLRGLFASGAQGRENARAQEGRRNTWNAPRPSSVLGARQQRLPASGSFVDPTARGHHGRPAARRTWDGDADAHYTEDVEDPHALSHGAHRQAGGSTRGSKRRRELPSAWSSAPPATQD